jgi:hypothetical protein
MRSQVKEPGPQREYRPEKIGAPDDGRHRLDVRGMESEERPGGQGGHSPEPEPQAERRDERRESAVQQSVDRVMPGRPLARQRVIESEGEDRQRAVEIRAWQDPVPVRAGEDPAKIRGVLRQRLPGDGVEIVEDPPVRDRRQVQRRAGQKREEENGKGASRGSVAPESVLILREENRLLSRCGG